MSKVIFDKSYNKHNLCDMDRDITEAFDPRFNSDVLSIPTDEDEMFEGIIRFTIEWFPCDENEL